MMHKTAYEVRISDWSSDVCSSDLVERQRTSTLRCRPDRSPALPSPRTSQFEDAPGPRSALFVQPRSPGRVRRPHAFRHPRRFGLENRRDRKIVVWGKSVSERVDFGGGRHIKKQKHKIEHKKS